jgi:signal-transduction protein with cAMP-binding, CBS, and nucleotidyltransferase domain
MISEGDLLRRVELGTERRRPRWIEFLIGPGRLATEYATACGRKVHEVMTTPVQTVPEDTPLSEIVKIMESRRIKRLPVVRDGRIVGIVSRANLLHALATIVPEARPTSTDDAAIRSRILAELQKETWAPVALIDVIVKDGVVHLWGTLTDERQRQAIAVAAENTPGVKQVVDHLVSQLVWLDPMSGAFIAGSDSPPQSS